MLRPTNRIRVPAIIAGGVVLATLVAPGGASAVPTERASAATVAKRLDRPFARSSFWNAPLGRRAPLDPRSGTYVRELGRQLGRVNPWINTDRGSTPVYVVPFGQRTTRVDLGNPTHPLQAQWDAVPIPRRAAPALGPDGHMVIWQPSTDTMWEFWLARKRQGKWHAQYGGRMENVSSNPGFFTDRRGATGTSLPLLGGLMRLRELRRGRIDHALAIAIPRTSAHRYSWPAQRSDGTDARSAAIPEGARFRIDPRVDLSKIRMSPIVRTMARAAQRYGMVVRDQAGAVAFYGEDPTPTGHDPYHGRRGLFPGYMNVVLRREFPWKHLQVLRTQPVRR